MSSMADILRAMDAADKPVAECPPEMGQMDQGGSINIQMNDAGQMAQLLQALQSVQQGGQGEAIEEGGMSDIDIQAQEFAQDAIEMAKDIQRDNYYFSDSTYFEFTDGLDIDNDALMDHDLVQTVLRALPNVDMEDEEIKQAVDALANMNIEENYSNEPEEEYMGMDAVLPSGDDLHKSKRSYPATAGGDNPMNVESIKDRLHKALAEKKMPMGAGPDGKKGTDDDKPAFLNQKTGDKKSKGGSKPKKGVVPPQFKKK